MATCPAPAYRARHPQNRPLYRIVYQYKDEFLGSYEELFENQYGPLRPVVRDVLERFIACGDLKLGFARVRCDTCHEEFLLPFSCKCRFFCDSCHQRKVLEWADWLQEHVLEEVPHRQVVFSLPKALRGLFLRDRTLLRELPKCAWRAMREYFHTTFQEKVIPGVVIAIQTFGSASINWNSHLHALATEGGWDEHGQFRPLSFFDDETLAELFRHEVFKMLLDRQRITETTIDKMRTWRYCGGFSVHSQTRLSGCDQEGNQQLARYIARNPVSQEKMSISPDGKVIYRNGTCRYPGDKDKEILHPLEFLARACLHIPDPYEPLSFIYGRYSNKTRALTRRFETSGQDEQHNVTPVTFTASSQQEPDTPYRKACRRRWAQLIQKVWLEDPVCCPKCSEKMRVVAFITKPDVIYKILDHLGLVKTDPPEPIPYLPIIEEFLEIP